VCACIHRARLPNVVTGGFALGWRSMSNASVPHDLDAALAQHRAELHRYCYRMLGSLADADDALQEAMLGAWKGIETFCSRCGVRPFSSGRQTARPSTSARARLSIGLVR
jgi:hypothetical protein